MPTKTFKIIIPANITHQPELHELSAAQILVKHFQRNVYFIKERGVHTADIRINNQEWEIKRIIGSGKYTVDHQLARAQKQSTNVVIDLRFTKSSSEKVIRRIHYILKFQKSLKKILIITKDEKVLTIK